MKPILVALIGGAVKPAGVVASNSRSRAVLKQKVVELSLVEKDNCLVERTVRLERDETLDKRGVEPLDERSSMTNLRMRVASTTSTTRRRASAPKVIAAKINLLASMVILALNLCSAQRSALETHRV